jgi:hypothetical protein
LSINYPPFPPPAPPPPPQARVHMFFGASCKLRSKVPPKRRCRKKGGGGDFTVYVRVWGCVCMCAYISYTSRGMCNGMVTERAPINDSRSLRARIVSSPLLCPRDCVRERERVCVDGGCGPLSWPKSPFGLEISSSD